MDEKLFKDSSKAVGLKLFNTVLSNLCSIDNFKWKIFVNACVRVRVQNYRVQK